ncbi:MAG: enoyl-ACP reductase [Nitrospirota bacterium]|jgi:enoyl-[acyl-carrier protein] reductase I
MGLLDSQIALIFGIANDRSICWGIAQALAAEGAELVFTYQGETMEKRVRPLADKLAVKLVLPCDATDDEQVEAVFRVVGETYGHLDVLVHGIAHATRDDLKGRFSDTSRAGFAYAMDVSAYSLVHFCRLARPLMEGRNGRIVTLTYYGAEKVIPNYHVMGAAKAALEASVRYLAVDLATDGMRINAISAGPIKTLAAVGISDFYNIGKTSIERAPLKRLVTQEEVGKAAVFLLADLSSAITGEVIHVDAGYHVIGM